MSKTRADSANGPFVPPYIRPGTSDTSSRDTSSTMPHRRLHCLCCSDRRCSCSARGAVSSRTVPLLARSNVPAEQTAGSADGRGPRTGHCAGLPHHIEPSEDQRADARQPRHRFVPAWVLFGSSWQLEQPASCRCEPRAGCRLRPLIGCCAALLLWSVVVGLCVGIHRRRPRSGGRSGPRPLSFKLHRHHLRIRTRCA